MKIEKMEKKDTPDSVNYGGGGEVASCELLKRGKEINKSWPYGNYHVATIYNTEPYPKPTILSDVNDSKDVTGHHGH